MRDPVKKLLAVLAVVALCTASFLGVFLRPGLVGHTWDWGIPAFAEQFASMARHHFSTWDAYFETGRYHYFKLELLYWQLITPLAAIGGEWMSKLLPWAFVTASGLAMLPLARRLGLNWFYATLAALFYGLSPYTYSRVVAGHMPMLAGFALIPLLLLAFFNLVERVRLKGRLSPRLVIVCGLTLGLTSLHPSVGVGSVAILSLVTLYFLVRGPGRARLLTALGLIFSLALLMNIHFMAPFLADYLGKGAIRHGWGLSASAKGEVTVDTELPMREGFHQSTSQPVDAVIRLDLRPGMDTEYAFPSPSGMRLPWVASSLILAGLALCSFMARGRRAAAPAETVSGQSGGQGAGCCACGPRTGREEANALFLVAVVGVLLVCGSRTPFGFAFYQWLLKGLVPILFAAFSNTTRWLPLIVTAYALLAFRLPQAWEEGGLKRPWLLRAGMLAVVLVFVSPFLGQKLLDNSPKDKIPQPLALKHTPVNPEDAKVYSFLRDQRDGFRVAYLPPVGISWPGDSPYGYEWSSAYSPKPFFLAFYNNPLGNEIIKTMFAEQPSPHLDRLFGLASVKYLVYPHDAFFISYQDFQPGYQGSPVVDGFKNYKPVLDRALSLQSGLTRVARFETVDLYRNPLAAPYVMAADQLLAVADASGDGADLVAASLPDVTGLDMYRPGQALVSAGNNPGFLALLGRVMGPESGQDRERAFLSDRSGKRQALVYRGRRYEPPSVEFRRLGPTACVVRLSGVREGVPLLFQETFHHGWRAYLMPAADEETGVRPASLAPGYRVFADNEAEQASPDELQDYVAKGFVSTLGDGATKIRRADVYGPGGRVVGTRTDEFTVDFVSKRFLTTVQNDNLAKPPLSAAWDEGSLDPADPARLGDSAADPLSPSFWRASGASEGRAMPWPELLHWQAQGYANVWWIEPEILKCLGPDASRYVRPNPAGGVDMEFVIEFRPQRFYLMGLVASGVTVALALSALAALSARAGLRGPVRNAEKGGGSGRG
ncbi:DUF2079 domain-containing protein [Fundidesulfovibrio terrae]|uniref:DUF2079 domain-containing protein n=1 Tax=Fundidesulfovibrio terrae TaxID=2922866 RepID=UPI001FAFC44B|nr:DUF2079 domain-containing protein [Fundidesulfovibrio terrae]